MMNVGGYGPQFLPWQNPSLNAQGQPCPTTVVPAATFPPTVSTGNPMPVLNQPSTLLGFQNPVPVVPQPANAAPVAPAQGQDPIDIFVIDDFRPEFNQPSSTNPNAFFNHGETVTGMIRAGGGDPSLAGSIQAHTINTDRSDMSRAQAIANALDQVIQIARVDPSKVDAINLSQAASQVGTDTLLVQQKIRELESLGVPVVIAAGNNGPNAPNTLASENSILVGSTDQNGRPLSDSGPGSVNAFALDSDDGKARQTSFATTEVTTLAAQLRAQGFSFPQIMSILQQRQAQSGGTLGGVPVHDVFTPGITVQ